MGRVLHICLIGLLTVALACPSQALAYHRFFFKKRAGYHLTANTALLWDSDTHTRYFDLGADKAVFPASTTKVLTALLVLENLSLDKIVTVSFHATRAPQSKLGLMPGESCRVRDLMYGLILKSANDAAVALAEAVAGSEEKFVEMMNARAKELGAVHSHFANPHGLPSAGPQFTTAADMALIFTQALKNDFFRQAITYKYLVVYSRQGHRFFLKSHNSSLFLNWRQHIFGKTGYTIEAQSCFVGYLPRDHHTLIIALYGCHRRWSDMKYIFERFGHINL